MKSIAPLLLTLMVILGLAIGCAVPTQESPSDVMPASPPEARTTAPEQPSGLVQAYVARVVDGDTIEVNIGGNSYRVRYIGIDTPETVQPGGEEATIVNGELLAGRTVYLEKDVSETDRYGRLLRYVWVEEGMVNAMLVAMGYAQVATYPPDVKYQQEFLELQRQAREAGLGLWAAPKQAPATEGVYVGSSNSGKYHYPWCRYATQISPDNEIWFSSAAEAQAMGYVPCKVCKPPTRD